MIEMRSIFTTLLLCLILCTCMAEDRVGKSYRIVGYGTVYQIAGLASIQAAWNANNVATPTGITEHGRYLRYISEGSISNVEYILYEYWEFDDSAEEIRLNGAVGGVKNYYLIAESVFDDITIEVPNRMQFSLLTVPIKVRRRPVDIAENASVGGALLYKPRRLRNLTLTNGLSIAAGAGLVTVALDSASTRGDITTATNARSLSAFGGLIYTLGDLNLCFMVGRDWVGAKDTKKWIYQNKEWFGVGIGLQFSSISGKGDGKN